MIILILSLQDIYSNKLVLINKNQLYDKMVNFHYRFIDPRLYQWLINKFNKLKKQKTKSFDDDNNFKKLDKSITFFIEL